MKKFIKSLLQFLLKIILGGAVAIIIAIIVMLFRGEQIPNFLEGLNIYLILAFILTISFFTLITSIGAWFQVFLHELGHLIAGKLSGYKFVSFSVGRFTIIRENGKLVRKRLGFPSLAGQCLMSPPDVADEQFKFPFTLYNLGGGLANITFSLLLLPIRLATSGIVSSVVLAIILMGILFALLSLIPLKLGGIPNDGFNVRLCKSSLENRRAFWIQLRYAALLAQGIRVRDMPREWFNDERIPESEIIGVLAMMWCYYLIDTGELEQARDYVKTILESPGKTLELHLNGLRCELLFVELVHECQPEEIEKLYTKNLQTYTQTMAVLVSTQRLLYAYECLHTKDETKAIEALANFEKACLNTPYRGELASERELIELVKQTAEAKKGLL